MTTFTESYYVKRNTATTATFYVRKPIKFPYEVCMYEEEKTQPQTMTIRNRFLFVVVIVIVLCTFLRNDWRSTNRIRDEIIPRDVSATSSSNTNQNGRVDNNNDDTAQAIPDRHMEMGTFASQPNQTTIMQERVAAAQAATMAPTEAQTPPTVAPTSTPVPPELLPKLPMTPAFNFTVKKSNGCFVNMTGNATMTHFPVRHRLDNLIEILQAGIFQPMAETGHKMRAICKFRKKGNYMHFPHMMQEFTRCFSFFQTYSNHAPYIVKRSHRRYRYSFNLGINNIFRDV